jgi:hypothetical protein
MARKVRSAAAIATLGVGLVAVTAVTLASANTSPYPADEQFPSVAGDEAAANLPAIPAMGEALVIGANPGTCLTDEQIVSTMEADKAIYGGELIMLTDGLEQAFADAWRREVDVERVKVSTVIIHSLPTEDAGRLADVVEFDEAGCALSRTMLSGDDFAMILERAAGREA